MSATSAIRDYGITMRPYLMFVSGAAGLVGLAMQPGEWSGGHLLAFTALFLSYGFGQALTDVFQVDTDSLSAPYRPLVQGTISRGEVLAVSATGLAGTAYVLTRLNPWNGVLVLVAAAGLASYTWFKRRFWGGPIWNAWIVALLPVIGVLSGGGDTGEALRAPALFPVVVVVFFAYAVFVMLGYFKDVEADRATGYNTLPVRFGRRPALWVSGGFAAVALVAAMRVAVLSPPDLPTVGGWVGVVLVVAGVMLLVRAHLRMLDVHDDAAAHPGIADSVRGFVVLHGGLAVLLRPTLWLAALLFIVAFEWTLAHRPERSQV